MVDFWQIIIQPLYTITCTIQSFSKETQTWWTSHSDIQETSDLIGCSLSWILSLHYFLQTEIRLGQNLGQYFLTPVTSSGVFPACARIEFGPKILEANQTNNHGSSTLLSKMERKFSKLLHITAEKKQKNPNKPPHKLGKCNRIAMRQ